METYVRRMARVLHALRIDNAHGTPLHVAAAMIDAARDVRPGVYVNAELFTGSTERDVEYIGRLGISSLVREAMNAGEEEGEEPWVAEAGRGRIRRWRGRSHGWLHPGCLLQLTTGHLSAYCC